MNITELQTRIGATPDGQFGPKSRAALVAHFTNKAARAISVTEMEGFAARLGCTLRQIAAVAAVESHGSGFDATGKPRILYERHIFHRLTGGVFSPASFSNTLYGGYSEPSWDKLTQAAGRNPDAAFSACSWGRFQVMGMHWRKLGYASAYDMAASAITGEAAHFEMLARYIETFGLKRALAALSTRAEDCRAFAEGYNGSDYRRNAYDTKLARAMA